MTDLRDPRTAVEVEAALTIRYRSEWPWIALHDAVETLAEEGFDRDVITRVLRVPLWFIASQYRQHHTALPDIVKDEA